MSRRVPYYRNGENPVLAFNCYHVDNTIEGRGQGRGGGVIDTMAIVSRIAASPILWQWREPGVGLQLLSRQSHLVWRQKRTYLSLGQGHL